MASCYVLCTESVLGRKKFNIPVRSLTSLPTGAVKSATETLGQKIIQGTYPSGLTLPAEPELAAAFGVSRTVVREAIKVLSGKGLVKTARRYGSTVLPMAEWNLLDPDVVGWLDPSAPIARQLFIDYTGLRCLIEPEAAASAARSATHAQQNLIAEAAEAIHPDVTDMERLLGAEYTFHATILEASGNILFGQLRRVIYPLLKLNFPTGRRYEAASTVSQNEHVLVAEAIRAGDADGARQAMSDMLEANRQIARKIAALV